MYTHFDWKTYNEPFSIAIHQYPLKISFNWKDNSTLNSKKAFYYCFIGDWKSD